FFPREAPATGRAAATEPAAAAAEPVQQASAPGAPKTLSASQRAEFDRWFQAQPYSPIAVPSDGAKVVIVKFNDYQCPPCRQTFMNYKSVLAKFQKSNPGQVKFITRDFPLESECNSGGPHPASCEAAAAVRMARLNGKAEA